MDKKVTIKEKMEGKMVLQSGHPPSLVSFFLSCHLLSLSLASLHVSSQKGGGCVCVWKGLDLGWIGLDWIRLRKVARDKKKIIPMRERWSRIFARDHRKDIHTYPLLTHAYFILSEYLAISVHEYI